MFLIGCSSAPPPLSVAEARSMQTRIIKADYNKVMKASVNVLQDLNYTLDEISDIIGIIIASRVSEKPQGEINEEETVVDEGTPIWMKVLGITLITAIVVGILFLILGGDDDDDDDDDDFVHRHSGKGATIIREGRSRHKVYKYRITINLDSINEQETKVRVSLQGQQMRGNDIERTGAVNDPEFFQRFFANLDKSLFLE
ncbi:MAG: hypothetical protein IIB41_07635 [Candidatus Marinimicrobia bacterium]|nr:hypothetical protein [Candidatus Neomarinimicrobiota bacterium]